MIPPLALFPSSTNIFYCSSIYSLFLKPSYYMLFVCRKALVWSSRMHSFKNLALLEMRASKPWVFRCPRGGWGAPFWPPWALCAANTFPSFSSSPLLFSLSPRQLIPLCPLLLIKATDHFSELNAVRPADRGSRWTKQRFWPLNMLALKVSDIETILFLTFFFFPPFLSLYFLICFLTVFAWNLFLSILEVINRK